MSLDTVEVISPALDSVLIPATAQEAEALSRLVSLQNDFIRIFQALGVTVVTELPPDE